MKTSPRTRVAIVGASGYAGEELLRLLLGHPHADIVAVTSRQSAGKTLGEIFPRFAGLKDSASLVFTEFDANHLARSADIVFLALPHGVSAEHSRPLLEAGARVIDLSADFRLKRPEVYEEFYGAKHSASDLLEGAVYGLPELRREEIRDAKLVACPGCYPTSILIPLVPLVRAKLVDAKTITITSISGVTGAGRKVAADYLFAECNESARAYGVPKHRHLAEIEQELSMIAAAPIVVQFTPHLVPMNRGIATTIYAEIIGDAAEIDRAMRNACAEEPFVRLLDNACFPDTKNVVATNFIDIAWRVDPRTNRIVLLSAIDNLTKGTSGQAIQCLNLMRGYAETDGLK